MSLDIRFTQLLPHIISPLPSPEPPKIPHKERLRQARYRSEHEEKLEENRIRKYMAELEAAKRSQQPPYENEKYREEMEILRRLGLLTQETR